MGLLQMLRAGLCWTPADHIIPVTPVLDATKGLPAKREGVRTDGLECRKAGHFRGAGPGPVKPVWLLASLQGSHCPHAPPGLPILLLRASHLGMPPNGFDVKWALSFGPAKVQGPFPK